MKKVMNLLNQFILSYKKYLLGSYNVLDMFLDSDRQNTKQIIEHVQK